MLDLRKYEERVLFVYSTEHLVKKDKITPIPTIGHHMWCLGMGCKWCIVRRRCV